MPVREIGDDPTRISRGGHTGSARTSHTAGNRLDPLPARRTVGRRTGPRPGGPGGPGAADRPRRCRNPPANHHQAVPRALPLRAVTASAVLRRLPRGSRVSLGRGGGAVGSRWGGRLSGRFAPPYGSAAGWSSRPNTPCLPGGDTGAGWRQAGKRQERRPGRSLPIAPDEKGLRATEGVIHKTLAPRRSGGEPGVGPANNMDGHLNPLYGFGARKRVSRCPVRPFAAGPGASPGDRRWR